MVYMVFFIKTTNAIADHTQVKMGYTDTLRFKLGFGKL